MGVATTIAVLVFGAGFLLTMRRTEQSPVKKYILASGKKLPEDTLAPTIALSKFEQEMQSSYLNGVITELLIGGILAYFW